jgi:ankyrin repeat protein
MAAFLALKAGDVDRLRALLRAHPDLARARGTNGNSLLNLAGSLAASALRAGATVSADERDAALAGIDALLAAGADADQPNDRGWTPLHQAAYSNQPVLCERLIAAGASPDAEAHGAGGTPLIVALFWGHREAADRLATHSVTPRNLRAAAGLGDLALIESFFAADGALLPDAGVARGFFRPHSGFPDWQPSTDPQQVLDEALVWACKSDRVDALERLVKGGARLDADPYRGTPLLWAAWGNRPRTVRWLLDHGAPVNQRATFGGPGHGQGVTALHLAAQGGHLSMATLLVERGADFTIQDDLYHGTPAGWAEHGGSDETQDYLRSLQAASGGA